MTLLLLSPRTTNRDEQSGSFQCRALAVLAHDRHGGLMGESEDAAGSRQNWSWSVGARRPRGLPLSGRGVRRYLHRRHRRNHRRNHAKTQEQDTCSPRTPVGAPQSARRRPRWDFRARACTARAHTNIISCDENKTFHALSLLSSALDSRRAWPGVRLRSVLAALGWRAAAWTRHSRSGGEPQRPGAGRAPAVHPPCRLALGIAQPPSASPARTLRGG